MLGVPHTSNHDFLLMLAIAWSADLNLKWLGKKSLFKPPLGLILRPLGGISVDRGNAGGMVHDLAKRLGNGSGWTLVIAPEGTRSKGEYWKSGFYRIAQETGLPVVLGFVDRTTRTTGLGPTIQITGNVKEDMDVVRAFYAGKVGVRPGNEGAVRLRMEEE